MKRGEAKAVPTQSKGAWRHFDQRHTMKMMKGKKCQFGMAECSYLGHVGGGGRVKVDGAKVEMSQETISSKDTRKQISTHFWHPVQL